MKYAEVMVGWLKGMGYTHCFFVAGGNCMHLLEAVRSVSYTHLTLPTIYSV